MLIASSEPDLRQTLQLLVSVFVAPPLYALSSKETELRQALFLRIRDLESAPGAPDNAGRRLTSLPDRRHHKALPFPPRCSHHHAARSRGRGSSSPRRRAPRRTELVPPERGPLAPLPSFTGSSHLPACPRRSSSGPTLAPAQHLPKSPPPPIRSPPGRREHSDTPLHPPLPGAPKPPGPKPCGTRPA